MHWSLTNGKEPLVTPGQQLPRFIYEEAKHFLCLCCYLPDVPSRPWQVQHVKLISVVIGVVFHFWLRNLYRQGFLSTKMNWDNLIACSKHNLLYLLHFTGFLKAALNHLLLLVISSIHPSICGTVFFYGTPDWLRTKINGFEIRAFCAWEGIFCDFLTHKLSIYIHLECFSFYTQRMNFSQLIRKVKKVWIFTELCSNLLEWLGAALEYKL